MSFVRHVRDDCLGALVDAAPFLKSLHVWGCTQLTDVFFHGIKNTAVVVVGKMDAN